MGADREVAIKVLSSELSHDATALARSERQAMTVAKLSHPHPLDLRTGPSSCGFREHVDAALQIRLWRTDDDCVAVDGDVRVENG